MDSSNINVESNERAEGYFKCDICDQEFKNKNSIRGHFNRIHNQKQEYICAICQKSGFRNQSKLASHIKVIHENKKYHKCDSCEKAFSTAGNMKNHDNKDTHKYCSQWSKRSQMWLLWKGVWLFITLENTYQFSS